MRAHGDRGLRFRVPFDHARDRIRGVFRSPPVSVRTAPFCSSCSSRCARRCNAASWSASRLLSSRRLPRDRHPRFRRDHPRLHREHRSIGARAGWRMRGSRTFMDLPFRLATVATVARIVTPRSAGTLIAIGRTRSRPRRWGQHDATKVLSFVVSSAMAGVAGGPFAHYSCTDPTRSHSQVVRDHHHDRDRRPGSITDRSWRRSLHRPHRRAPGFAQYRMVTSRSPHRDHDRPAGGILGHRELRSFFRDGGPRRCDAPAVRDRTRSGAPRAPESRCVSAAHRGQRARSLSSRRASSTGSRPQRRGQDDVSTSSPASTADRGRDPVQEHPMWGSALRRITLRGMRARFRHRLFGR